MKPVITVSFNDDYIVLEIRGQNMRPKTVVIEKKDPKLKEKIGSEILALEPQPEPAKK